MALDTLTGMAVFRDAVRTGSLAAAARRAGLSAEMAGRHLRALEERLGVRLLNRSTRRLALTEAGRSYFARCVAILDEVESAENEAAARQDEPRGSLRVAAPLAFATAALAPAVESFLDRHPGVAIRFDLSERPVDLLGEGFDLALRLGELPDSGLVARRLAAFPLRLVAAPAYLAARPPIRTPEELEGQAALIYTQTAAPHRLTLTDAAGATRTVALAGRLEASDVGFLIALAERGAGVVVAPSFLVADALAEGRLMPVLPDWSARSLTLHALLPHRALLPAATRRFVEFLAAWFAAWPDGSGPA